MMLLALIRMGINVDGSSIARDVNKIPVHLMPKFFINNTFQPLIRLFLMCY